MATRYNYTGKLVTDGLVLNLDAAKRDSYPGSGTTWYDLSGNGNNGTLTNGPTYTGVSKDAAIVFDGTNDNVDCGNINYNRTTFSVGSWCNFPTYHSNWKEAVVSKWNIGGGTGGGNEWSLGPDYSTGPSPFSATIQYAFGSGQTFTIRDTVDYKINTWYNTCFTWDSGSLKLYKNGTLVGSGYTPNPSAQTTTQPVYLAKFYTGTQYTTNVRIASAQIYNKALTHFDIWQNFNATKGRYGIPDIVTDGLVLNLDAGNPYSYLSGSSGTTWTDVSGQGNNGTLTNGTSYANGAISFDGVDDYVDTNSTVVDLNSSFTFAAWIKTPSSLSSNTNYRRLIGRGDNSSTYTGEWAALAYNFNGDAFSIAIDDDTTKSEYLGNITLSVNTWYYAVMVVDRQNNLYLYVNGVLDGSVNDTTSLNVNPPYNLYIGAMRTSNQISYPLNGTLSAAQVYNRALTQAEITQNFNALRGRYGI